MLEDRRCLTCQYWLMDEYACGCPTALLPLSAILGGIALADDGDRCMVWTAANGLKETRKEVRIR